MMAIRLIITVLALILSAMIACLIDIYTGHFYGLLVCPIIGGLVGYFDPFGARNKK